MIGIVIVPLEGFCGAHILLALYAIEQSCCFFSDFAFLFCSVVAFLFCEVLSQSVLVLATVEFDIDAMSFLLLLKIVDVDVDRGHAIARLLGNVAETGRSVAIVSALVLFSNLIVVFLGRPVGKGTVALSLQLVALEVIVDLLFPGFAVFIEDGGVFHERRAI